MGKLAGAGLAVIVALSSCQLFGGATQVRFLNSTSACTLGAIVFGSVSVRSSLAPAGAETGYYPIAPGQALLQAQNQADGAWTNGIQLSITAGHSFTITFSGTTFSSMTVSIAADP